MFALIGETLRRLRRDKGLTLEALGKSAELGRGQLSRIENSHQEATLSTLAKILNSQGVSRREFFRRYDLVESEALAVERQQAGGAVPAEGEGSWPQEIQDVLNRVESFVDATLHQPRPVAQGAFEVGDLVVLFRVVPKNPESGPPRKPGGEPAAAPPKAPAPGTKRRPGTKHKR
jgi:transcriptional regulator with XRE-family HTH domain